MLFSRQFVQILNAAAKLETGKGLSRMRTIVQKWVTGGRLGADDLQWLNSRGLRHRTLLRAGAGAGPPGSTVELESPDAEQERIAASSFAEFLAEVQESRTTGAGRLAVKICPGCQEVFVQGDSGRDKLVCSARCKFRLRRQAQKDREKEAPRKRPSGKRGGKNG